MQMGINLIREDLNDLLAFVVVARGGSFTRAAARLGVSQSAVSRAVRSLEKRLGLTVLSRTTRSVSLTEAGVRLLQAIGPRFDEIDDEVRSLGELRERPSGTVRITATDYAANTYVWPRLVPLLREHPDIRAHVINDYGLTNIVAQRYDIGVRLGEQVEKDMVATRISPDLTLAVVASPAYLQARGAPKGPKDLSQHDCINLWLHGREGFLPWELRKGRRDLQVQVHGQVAFNNVYQMLEAALAGFGLAYMPAELATPHVQAGRLAWVLEDWYPTFSGFHAYYPSRHTPRAVALVVEALRAGRP